MPSKFLTTKNLALILIIATASFFRLYRIGDYAEYLGDQGRDLIIIRNFLVNRDLFFIGPQTSIGNMYLGPYFYYLISPSLLLSNFHPLGPIVFTALLGVLTVYLVYRVALVWFNRHTALLSSLLYAVSPVVIRYTTFSWNPNILPLFSLLFIYLLSRYTVTRLPKYLYFANLSFILCLNSHYLALLLLPPAFLMLFFFWQKNPSFRRQLLNQILVNLLIFILSLAPQILFDIKHHGQNISAIFRFFSQRETTVSLKPYKAIPYFVPMFNFYVTRLLAATNTLIGIFVSLFIALSLLAYFLIPKTKNSHQTTSPLIILITWIFWGILGLSLYKQHVYDHYLGFINPAVFILFSYLLIWLYSRFKLSRPLVWIAIIFLIAKAILTSHFFQSPNRQISTSQQIVDSIIADSGSNPFNLALLAKQNYDSSYRYLFSLKNAPVKDAHDQITQQLYVICEPWQIDCQPINNPQWEVASFGWAKIDKQWEINGITVFRLIHNY
jgi:4-amino-4-deoxy-L-arabinose transferase-like glycosyltransferase